MNTREGIQSTSGAIYKGHNKNEGRHEITVTGTEQQDLKSEQV
jgi:hypothetical protein